MLAEFMNSNRLPNRFKTVAEHVYIPLAERIYQQLSGRDSGAAPYFVGVNGCQGSGKSTFSAFIASYLSNTHGLTVVSMSLDDFYLSTNARQSLAVNIHPLLATRGVPGTHNVQCLGEVLTDLENGTFPCKIPTFNKALDEPYEQESWQAIKSAPDVVLLEGWCWGVPAQSTEQLQTPINALEKSQDADASWRTYVNDQIKSDYQPLYGRMNYWIAIQAPSFNCVHRWRLEQEQKLALSLEGSNTADKAKLMDSAQVLAFIQFFQRLTEHGMNTLPNSADATLLLDESRNISRALFKG